MPDHLEELLAAERQGRSIIHHRAPRSGEPWEITVDSGGGAWLAAARWADRHGANVSVHLAAGAAEDPICAVLAEPLRRSGLLSPSPVGERTGGLPPPPSGSAWSMPLTGNGALFVRPAGADDATLTVEETREIDRRSIEDYALPGLCLMENAAVGAVMATCDLMGEGDWHAVIAAGGGNNAGDGLAAARGLAALGKRVTVLLLKDPGRLSPDAAANYRLLGDPPAHAAVVDAHASPAVLEQALADCDVVVDALLGTGFSGELAGPLLRAVEMINASSAPAVALDLPSGMSGNEGVIGPAVKAVRTVAFGNRKPGLLAGESIPLTGNVFIAEIGAPGPAAPPLRRGGA